MKYLLGVSAVLMLVAAGCVSENPVATDTAVSPPDLIPEFPKSAPFHAHEENTIVFVSQVGDVATFQFPGTIEGDHIGSGTIFTTSEVNNATFVQTGVGVITAANGDELNWAFEGTFDADFFFSGDFTFEGGTGRFADASGGGTYTGTADPIAFVGQFDLDGVISR